MDQVELYGDKPKPVHTAVTPAVAASLGLASTCKVSGPWEEMQIAHSGSLCTDTEPFWTLLGTSGVARLHQTCEDSDPAEREDLPKA